MSVVTGAKTWVDWFNHFVITSRDSFGFSNRGLVVVLDSPNKLTVKNSSLARPFSKKAFIGGEKFECNGCYVGKSGKVIYTFTEVAPGNHRIEVPEHELHGAFPDFANTVEEYALSLDEDELRAFRSDGEKIEAEAHALALAEARKSDQRFGSW